MRIRLDRGPLDGLAFDCDQAPDKLVILTDGAHLVRYRTVLEDVRLAEAPLVVMEHVSGYDLTEDFDAELAESMRRAGSQL